MDLSFTQELLLWLFLGLLTASSAFCSGSEVALFSLSLHKVDSFSTSSDPIKRRIATLLASPKELLVTIFILNSVVNILLQNVASSLFEETHSWLYKVVFPLVLTLVLGEVLPKYFSLRYNEPLAYKVGPAVEWLHRKIGWVRRLTIALIMPVSRGLFFFLQREKPMSREEVIYALSKAEEQQVITPEEKELSIGFLELLDKDIGDCMRPREDLLLWDSASPLEELRQLLLEGGEPVLVVEGGLEKVLGLISGESYFLHEPHLEGGSPKKLTRYLKKPLYVPEQGSARALLCRFYREKEESAIVVDEYGNVVGIVGLEDLAEEVIGQIADSGEKMSYAYAGPQQLIVSGRMEIEELNRILAIDLESEQMATIGGWLSEQLDAIPKVGTKYEKDQLFFHVLEASPSRIQRVYIKQLGVKEAQNQAKGAFL